MNTLAEIIDLHEHPVANPGYRERCRAELERNGALALEGFIAAPALARMQAEAGRLLPQAYFNPQRHNVYLLPPDPAFPADHPRNREVLSSKGCVCDDEIAEGSPLRALYDAPGFRDFLCDVLGEAALHPYADPLSSVNIHYARTGEELGWHFDNSSFAITLMIRAPEAGGAFEYVPALRDADNGEMNFDGVAEVLDGRRQVLTLRASSGTLALFRGRNALHRVAPVEGGRARMLAVLAYNSAPGVCLSESARMTFYGRLA